jgi:hypothetical protein
MRASLLLLAPACCLLAVVASPAWAAKLGETCDGIAAIRCDEGLWCEHQAGECQMADGAGRCVEESGPFCVEIFMPVCACGGVQYANDCVRKAAKAQLDYRGACHK